MDFAKAAAVSIGVQIQPDAKIGTLVHHQHGTPDNDRRLGELAQTLERSLALQREQAIKELIAEHEIMLDEFRKLVDENIVEFVRENIDTYAAADFWNAPRDGLFIVVCWFFQDQATLPTDRTREGLLRDFETRPIRCDFAFAQWIRLDSINNMMSDAIQRLDFMRGKAQAIGAVDIFDRWATRHPTSWYRDAFVVMQTVKPRVDDIRATWNDAGALALRILKKNEDKK